MTHPTLWPITRLPRIALCCAVLIGLLGGVASAAHYDLYVLAGQSNMDGRGLVKDLVGPLAPYAGVRDKAIIWYSNGTLRRYDGRSQGWEPLQPGFAVPPGVFPTTGPNAVLPATRPGGRERYPVPNKYFGPEVAFAKAVLDANPAGPPVAVLKFAVSGANLRKEWNADRRELLYDQFLASARDAFATMQANGDTYTLRAFLWHQGESDADLTPEAYEKLLAALIARVRRDFNDPTLPIVLGEPFDNGKRLGIRTAQRNLAKTQPNVYCVSSVGLTTGDRDTHFDAASQIELGRRFAEAVLKKSDAGPVPPPTTMATTRPAVTEEPN